MLSPFSDKAIQRVLIDLPSDIPQNKILRISKTVVLLVTTSINNAKKAIYHLKRNNRSKKKSIRVNGS